jgi:hypothetical protein
MNASLLVLASVIIVAAVLVGLWAPGRDGRQLKLVARATRGRDAPKAEALVPQTSFSD